MEPQTQEAFRLAVELSKQIMALATGAIALTITFRKEVLGGSNMRASWLWASWLFYLVAVIGALWHLMALTGTLASSAPASLSGWNVRLPAMIAIGGFGLATLLIISYGILAVRNR